MLDIGRMDERLQTMVLNAGAHCFDRGRCQIARLPPKSGGGAGHAADHTPPPPSAKPL